MPKSVVAELAKLAFIFPCAFSFMGTFNTLMGTAQTHCEKVGSFFSMALFGSDQRTK
jgi:hypothetical protein